MMKHSSAEQSSAEIEKPGNAALTSNKLNNRALSSAGSERLPYKQRVGGSNPSAPTKAAGIFPAAFFVRKSRGFLANLAEVAGVAEVAEVAGVAKIAKVAKVAEIAGVAELAKIAEVAEVAESAESANLGGGYC